MEEKLTKRYVCGFLFKDYSERNTIPLVAMIRKRRGPYDMSGKLNGIGGKIEAGETPYIAMVREFKEETGADIQNWHQFLTLRGKGWEVHFFKAVGDCLLENTTDEEVDWYHVYELIYENGPNTSPHKLTMMKNLKWILPMAMDDDISFADIYDHSEPS